MMFVIYGINLYICDDNLFLFRTKITKKHAIQYYFFFNNKSIMVFYENLLVILLIQIILLYIYILVYFIIRKLHYIYGKIDTIILINSRYLICRIDRCDIHCSFIIIWVHITVITCTDNDF